jgi:hypothetical protein
MPRGLYFIGYRRPKSSLIRFSLGGVWTVAESVRMDNCATGFPKALIFFPE